MTDIASKLLDKLNFEATTGQRKLSEFLERFVDSKQWPIALIIKGYAGTGKTSMLAVFVQYLKEAGITCIQLAPTGRAAKVFSGMSGDQAFTIHKHIYVRKQGKNGTSLFIRKKNVFKNTIYIVDEASMISSNSSVSGSLTGRKSLMDDLIEFIKEGKNCKLILVGDDAQLPPIGTDVSEALLVKTLEQFGFKAGSITLTEVVRQIKHSMILNNATALRNQIKVDPKALPQLERSFDGDVEFISPYDVGDRLEEAYRKYGKEETMIICRSNFAANQYNLQIRSQVFQFENEITTGDQLMVVKNNYYWLEGNAQSAFIANGDLIEVNKIYEYKELHNQRFARIEARFIDYPNMPAIELNLLMGALHSKESALPDSEFKLLYESVKADYLDLQQSGKIKQAIKDDPWYNALQVKYGYAITCHKGQGGQWKAIFVDAGFIKEEEIDKTFLRWLYTAITRASEKLYLINFERFDPISRSE